MGRRRPKPSRLKVLTGNPGKRPLNIDELPPEMPSRTAHLSSVPWRRGEWHRPAGDLAKLRTFISIALPLNHGANLNMGVRVPACLCTARSDDPKLSPQKVSRCGSVSIETTQTYLHAHLALKEAALAKLKPYEQRKRSRFQANDRLLAFLEAL